MPRKHSQEPPDEHPTPKLTDAELAELTVEYRAVQRRAQSNLVEAAAEMGRIIRRAREGLEWGRFERWLSDKLKSNTRSALRLAAIAGFADNHPLNFDRLKGRGVSIVGDLASLPPPALERILKTRKLKIDGAAVPLLTASPLMVRKALKPLRVRPTVMNARARAESVRTAAQRALERARSLEGRWDRVPQDVLRDMAAALADLCAWAKRRPWE